MGIKGEVKVFPYSYDSDNLKEGKVLLLKRVSKNTKDDVESQGISKDMNVLVKNIRYQKSSPVIWFEGIDDRNAAEEIKGMEIFVEADELEELPEGEHYVRDIIGYRVVDLPTGETVGILQDVIQNTAQSILDVKTDEGKQVLIPAVDAFMKKIDSENKTIEVELIPGFI